jgi:hypothetical protein
MTKPQLRLVYGVSRTLGFDSDVLHSLVHDWTGKDHLTDLRRDEAHRVINRLKALANQTPDQAYNAPTSKVAGDGTIIEYCSPAQAYMLRYLCRQLGVNLARLWAIIEARFGLTQADNTLDDLTHHDAHVLILQFKGELALAKAKQEAAARQGALGV